MNCGTSRKLKSAPSDAIMPVSSSGSSNALSATFSVDFLFVPCEDWDGLRRGFEENGEDDPGEKGLALCLDLLTRDE